RVMVAKFIRVAKRFLSGAVNPADARWCHASLDANELMTAKGVGPGGGVKLPTHQEMALDTIELAFWYPGIPVDYSKLDVNE